MHRATLTIDPARVLAPVHRRLYGSFVEHLGRCVYDGIYEPGHPEADEDGLRRDVLELIRELGPTLVRYPGGNFVSGYRWEDSVGPKEERPRRLDLAWHATETNQFGLDEFMRFVRKVDAEPMMAVNLGTRGVEAAIDLLDYANHPGGTAWSDARRANGAEQPHDIRVWCLGNEMDGPWQIGQTDAETYGTTARAAARAMKAYDADLDLVVCGSSAQAMPTFGEWERVVLEKTYDSVSHVSCHAYYEERPNRAPDFLASAVDMESFIDNVVATADAVGARLKSKKRIMISFDEWNVWYQRNPEERPDIANEKWQVAPRQLEDRYNVTDAVVTGSLLIALLRHADRVTAACQAQLVNVIAPIMTEPGGPAWRQTTFFPFAQAARYGRGESLVVESASPTEPTQRYGEVPVLHTAATREADGTVTLFAVNRSLTEPVALEAAVGALGAGVRVLEHQVLADEDRFARNTLEDPERVRPYAAKGTSVADGTLRAELPPVSWSMIRLAPAE